MLSKHFFHKTAKKTTVYTNKQLKNNDFTIKRLNGSTLNI